MSLVRRLWGQRSPFAVGAVRFSGDGPAPVTLVAAGVGALLLLAAVGLAPPPADLPTVWSAPGLRAWMVVVPALGWVAAATWVLARTMPRPRHRTALRRAVLLEAVLLAAAAALLARTDLQIPRQVDSGGGQDLLPVPDLPLPLLPLPDPLLLLLLFALGAAGGVVLALWSVWEVRDRFLRPRGARSRDPRYGRGHARSAEQDLLLSVLLRARAALVSDEAVRRAVIAAYAALEGAVAGHGEHRSSTQTPAEYLHAALESGVLHARAEALELLGLFHRARFSHEPMDASDRTRALRCLDALRDDLTHARTRP